MKPMPTWPTTSCREHMTPPPTGTDRQALRLELVWSVFHVFLWVYRSAFSIP